MHKNIYIYIYLNKNRKDYVINLSRLDEELQTILAHLEMYNIDFHFPNISQSVLAKIKEDLNYPPEHEMKSNTSKKIKT